jgi:hypothetical protein
MDNVLPKYHDGSTQRRKKGSESWLEEIEFKVLFGQDLPYEVLTGSLWRCCTGSHDETECSFPLQPPWYCGGRVSRSCTTSVGLCRPDPSLLVHQLFVVMVMSLLVRSEDPYTR